MAKARATEAEIARAIKATRSCGLSVSGVEIEADGTIRVLTGANNVATDAGMPKPSRPKQWRT